MTATQELGVGIIGLGFMGRTHLSAYQQARAEGLACRIVAVCDRKPDRRASIADELPSDVRSYDQPDALLADTAVRLVSICTHTDTHVELAIRALQAGKHVLVEKPVALNAADVRRLRDAADQATTRCMPAMCMRFWPGWVWLRHQIAGGAFGPVRSAVFRRIGSGPDWAPDFYRDFARSGGAFVDLHIHDVDFLRWCFGDPEAVVSTGSVEHVTTLYRFPAGPEHVVAEAGWDRARGLPFNMTYRVTFEQATAEFDLNRGDRLLVGRDGSIEPIELGPLTGYDLQARHFLEACANEERPLNVTLEDALRVTELLEAERRSLENRAPVAL